MATIELIHKRVGNDLQIVVQLFDNETPIDWTTVKRIFPVLYSDSQRVRMGMCRVLGVDPQDHSVLRLSYSGKQPQYKGVARLVIELNYMESTCTVDCPALVFVEATADEGVGPVEVEIDTNVDPEINSLRIVIGGGGSATWGNIGGDIEDQTDLMNALAAKQDTIADLATIEAGAAAGATAVQPGDLATVATSGSYADLTGKPTIPAAQVNSDWNADSGIAKILNKPSLATVATTGSYDDLTNKPTIPDVTGKADKVSGATSGDFAGLDAYGNLTDSGSKAADFATAAQGAKADTAVQPGDLATVATSGDYDDLLNKPTIPAAQVQADWNEADNTKADYIKNKPTIPAAQVNSDWNAASGVAQILNKPTIPAAPGTLDTTATTAQATSSSEALSGSVTLHKISKTGKYSDLSGRPTVPVITLNGSTAGNPSFYAPTGAGTAGQVLVSTGGAPTWQAAPSGGVQDVTVGGTSVVSGGVAAVPAIPSAPGTLDTTATTAQATSASEALSGSVTLHKVAKTGTYSDLIGTPAIPTVPTISTDVAADKADNSKTTGAKAVYDFVKPATGSSIPAGGLLPGVKYHLGTLSGSVTMTLAAAADASVENEYKGDFTADSTPPTITWQGVTQWAGNCLDEDTGLPVLTGGKHYEFNIENGYGIIAEFGV